MIKEKENKEHGGEDIAGIGERLVFQEEEGEKEEDIKEYFQQVSFFLAQRDSPGLKLRVLAAAISSDQSQEERHRHQPLEIQDEDLAQPGQHDPGRRRQERFF
jgi:hypothetical protein